MSLVSNVPGHISNDNDHKYNEEEEDEFFDAQSEMDPERYHQTKTRKSELLASNDNTETKSRFRGQFGDGCLGPKERQRFKALSCEAYRIFSKSISASISTKMIRKVRITKPKVEFLRKRPINSMYY